MSGRPPRASAVKAAEFIQAKVHNNNGNGATPVKLEADAATNGAAPATAPTQPIATPSSSPPAAASASMPPPSDDEAMVDHGGSSEDEMDADEAQEEEEELGSPPPRTGAAADLADRDDNSLTVEELKIKYGFAEPSSAPVAPARRHRHEESKAERHERKRLARREKKEKRRQRREEAARNGNGADSSDESDDEPQTKEEPADDADQQDEESDDEDEDASFEAGEDGDESDEEMVVHLLPEPKTSRVGPRFQSDLPALLSADERAAELASLDAQGQPLEGVPNTAVYVPPVESPEEHARRMGELAERQRMHRMMAKAREARRRAAERELEREEAQAREERERRRKKEAARAREAAAQAATAAAADRHNKHKRRRGEDEGPLPAGAAQLPSDLPSALLHGHILQSFPSSSAAAAGGRAPRFQAHYVSLFQEDNESKLVGIAFDRAEVEEALRGGKQNFREFLREKLGVSGL